uniref:BG antigen n=1 Tax=Gallus gallus TaxID=9031 RepID=A5HUJ0_CHICK|nr:BG antigen [Gallus gallus]
MPGSMFILGGCRAPGWYMKLQWDVSVQSSPTLSPIAKGVKFLSVIYHTLKQSKRRSWAYPRVSCSSAQFHFLLGCNNPSFALPWRTLMLYLVALHLLQLGSAQLTVVAPSLRVTANVGQDVVLRCHLCPCKNAWSSDIRWIQLRSSGFVHHYRNGEDLEQMTEYKGRTELLRKGLSDGNLDLRITAVSSSDSGLYSCAVQDGDDGYAEALVELEVSDPFSQIVHPWKVALAVIVTILVGSFVIIAFLYRKKVTQSRELKRKDAMLGRKDAVLEELPAILDSSAANLKILASKLVKQTEKLDIRNSLMKKQYKMTEKQAAELEKHLINTDLSAAELKIAAAKLDKQTEELDKWKSALKIQYEKLALRAANLKKQVTELAKQTKEVENHYEEMGLRAPNLKKNIVELEKQTKHVENRKSVLKKQYENLASHASELKKQAEVLEEQAEQLEIQNSLLKIRNKHRERKNEMLEKQTVEQAAESKKSVVETKELEQPSKEQD